VSQAAIDPESLEVVSVVDSPEVGILGSGRVIATFHLDSQKEEYAYNRTLEVLSRLTGGEIPHRQIEIDQFPIDWNSIATSLTTGARRQGSSEIANLERALSELPGDFSADIAPEDDGSWKGVLYAGRGENRRPLGGMIGNNQADIMDGAIRMARDFQKRINAPDRSPHPVRRRSIQSDIER
jgi:hypothetical protein